MNQYKKKYNFRNLPNRNYYKKTKTHYLPPVKNKQKTKKASFEFTQTHKAREPIMLKKRKFLFGITYLDSKHVVLAQGRTGLVSFE